MTILVVGASGATGRLLVHQLLDSGNLVRVVVRVGSDLPETITAHPNLTVIRANILDLNKEDMAQLVEGCGAIASCLGHTLSFQGIWGPPYRLVTDAVRKLCQAVRTNHPDMPVKFVLMNTTGNSNRDIPERISFAQSCVIWLLRLLIPPHADNEQAADFLRTKVGSNDSDIEWVAVRPDSLVNEPEVTEYELYPSPIRSAIFDAGNTSRMNVAHFMTLLATEPGLWSQWKGKMPVIYNVT